MESDGSDHCIYRTDVLRCSDYLGVDVGTPEEIAAVLNPVLTEHGMDEVSAPQGSEGGWLEIESEGRSSSFSFRAKGYTEIAVTALIEGPQCTMPTS